MIQAKLEIPNPAIAMNNIPVRTSAAAVDGGNSVMGTSHGHGTGKGRLVPRCNMARMPSQKGCRETRNGGGEDKDWEVADTDAAATPYEARQQGSAVQPPARKIDHHADNAGGAINAMVSAEYRDQTQAHACKEKTPAGRLLGEKRQNCDQYDRQRYIEKFMPRVHPYEQRDRRQPEQDAVKR